MRSLKPASALSKPVEEEEEDEEEEAITYRSKTKKYATLNMPTLEYQLAVIVAGGALQTARIYHTLLETQRMVYTHISIHIKVVLCHGKQVAVFFCPIKM
jgi:hypothetical protein